MTPARLAWCMAALGISERTLARLLDLRRATVRGWLTGSPIPPNVAEWLERRVADPPPRATARPAAPQTIGADHGKAA